MKHLIETNVNPAALARLEIVRHRLTSVAESMGSALVKASRSANIKERGDLSCAVFDADGRLIAQAAHIPVHLGALESAVEAARIQVSDWDEGDVIVLNDPYSGGSHLPDLTTVSAVFAPLQMLHGDAGALGTPSFFLATRAHHADIGGSTPGSLSIASDLFGEGLILPPVHLARRGVICDDIFRIIGANSRTPDERKGDLEAQVASHSVGSRRLAEVMTATIDLESACSDLLEWSGLLTETRLQQIPEGVYRNEDQLDDDGLGGGPFRIQVEVTIKDGRLHADFSGTAEQAKGGINAPLAVTRSAVSYVAACLVGDAPINAGVLSRVSVYAPAGSLLAPYRPAPVAGGNVETSQRVVDVVLGALAQAAPRLIPAASQGTMNNVLAGSTLSRKPWAYYETIGGGSGASAAGDGASGIQVHMTNTRNTPIEAVEMDFPVRIERYALRRGSGGIGMRMGGDGIIRVYRFLESATISILSERRESRPPGVAGGKPGQPGKNILHRRGHADTSLSAKATLTVGAGDLIEIQTPGGGGWGTPVSPGPGPGSESGPE